MVRDITGGPGKSPLFGRLDPQSLDDIVAARYQSCLRPFGSYWTHLCILSTHRHVFSAGFPWFLPRSMRPMLKMARDIDYVKYKTLQRRARSLRVPAKELVCGTMHPWEMRSSGDRAARGYPGAACRPCGSIAMDLPDFRRPGSSTSPDRLASARHAAGAQRCEPAKIERSRPCQCPKGRSRGV